MPVQKTKRRSGSERRVSARADAKLSMRVEAREEAHAQIVTESQNISASGVYCNSPHFLAPLSKVALTIVLPRLPGRSHAQELVKVEGIVVRCESQVRRGDRPFELACMFTGLDTKRRAIIDEFVTWRNLQALRAATATVGPARPRAKTAAGATRKSAVRSPAARAAAGRKTARRPAAKTAATRGRSATR